MMKSQGIKIITITYYNYYLSWGEPDCVCPKFHGNPFNSRQDISLKTTILYQPHS